MNPGNLAGNRRRRFRRFGQQSAAPSGKNNNDARKVVTGRNRANALLSKMEPRIAMRGVARVHVLKGSVKRGPSC